MDRRSRIGLFGGTFDPVHHAHIDIARAARDQAGLDRLLFIVAARPPHKPEVALAPAEDRYAMVERAIAGEVRMAASRVELDREGASYTVDTLRTLEMAYPGAEFHLILGADSVRDLPQWRDTEEILARSKLLVVPRPGHYEIPPELRGNCTWLDFTPVDLSSTEIRRRLRLGAPLTDLLPAAVEQYIRDRGLYDAVKANS